jgi:hypothetical protein
MQTRLERFRAKWTPVRVKKTRQNKKIERGCDSIQSERALGNDPEKWKPVFGKDHSQTRRRTTTLIQQGLNQTLVAGAAYGTWGLLEL